MPAPEPSLLHAWLALAATRHPDRPAVIEPDATISIGELAARAQAIAAALAILGVARGDRVAIVLDKSIDAIAALYGTLAAGAVYVPLAPHWPARRQQAALEQCDARVVIRRPDGDMGQPLLVAKPSGVTIPWADALRTPVGPDLASDVRASDPAFILYTSGTTGVPKGVTISHRAVGAFVDWTAETFGIGPDDRLLCPAPLGFDLSTFDVLNIARAASASVVASETVTWVPRFLTAFAREQSVTMWYSVPSLLGRLLDDSTFGREPLPALRTILFAGEIVQPSVASRLRRSYPTADLCNLYGPTETNVVTWHRLGDDVDVSRPIPIGVPCPYARVRLDPADVVRAAHGEAESGHLLVAGDSLMNGYWARPDDTRAALVEGWYRTGDRVTIHADGVVDFRGRQDRQVKRRGFRIELEEIEAALATSPDVAEAGVVAEGESGSVVIRAYVRPRTPGRFSPVAIRAHCAAILPAHSLPDEFVALETMPRGARGKIDYQALSVGTPRSE